jgi:putative methanogenesis marker protein 8
MECMGKTRVVIEDGKVTEVGEPQVRYCPLFKKYRGIEEITPETVRENVEYRMNAFGMCRDDRQVRMKDFISFGVSEILSSAIRDGVLDAAVIAADGCGTVVVRDPEIVQGLGGRISGICETSPIGNVIDQVGRDNVLDPQTAAIDMAAGVRKAKGMGLERVAVTVASADHAKTIRSAYGAGVTIIAVHISGSSEDDAAVLFENCDIVTGCASWPVREEAKRRGVFTAGSKIPVFGVSEIGRMLISKKLEEIGKAPFNGSEDPPRPLI